MKDLLISIAKEAGHILRQKFLELQKGAKIKINEKSKSDFVTSVDIEVEEFIKEKLTKTGIPIMGEETSNNVHERTAFVVDPIDGTKNFMKGIPHFAVNLGFIENGQTLLGITYDPMKDELFVAEKGKGTSLNGTKVNVSSVEEFDRAVIALGLPYRGIRILDKMIKLYELLYKEGAGIRHTGSAALDLAYTAMGRYEGFVEFFLSPWDVLPGILMVEEAGGSVGSIEGLSPQEGWVIAGGKIFLKLKAVVSDIFKSSQ